MFCRNCGNELTPEAQFCQACGCPVVNPEAAAEASVDSVPNGKATSVSNGVDPLEQNAANAAWNNGEQVVAEAAVSEGTPEEAATSDASISSSPRVQVAETVATAQAAKETVKGFRGVAKNIGKNSRRGMRMALVVALVLALTSGVAYAAWKAYETFIAPSSSNGAVTGIQAESEYVYPWVVSKEHTTVTGWTNASDYSTYYTYDEKGRLVQTMTDPYMESAGHGARVQMQVQQTFEYEGDNLVYVTTEDVIDGNLGREEAYEYDDEGRCIRSAGTATNKAYGSETLFTYDEQGRVVETMSNSSYALAREGDKLVTYTDSSWGESTTSQIEYTSDGKMLVDGEEQDNPYEQQPIVSDTVTKETSRGQESNKTEKTYDQYGNLVSVVVTTSDSVSSDRVVSTEYEYVQIKVKRSDFKPNVYTNPGFASDGAHILLSPISIDFIMNQPEVNAVDPKTVNV